MFCRGKDRIEGSKDRINVVGRVISTTYTKKIKDGVLSEEKQHMSDIYCERKCHRKSLLGCVAFDSIIMV